MNGAGWKSAWQRGTARARALSLLPRGPSSAPLASLLPRTPAEWAATLALWALLLLYVTSWVRGNREFLFDVDLQPDDARTALISFHAYGPERSLADDPIAREMRAFIMPGMWLPFRLLTPIFGVYAAVKVVQGVCLAIALYAGWLLLRSRRAGLAAAALLVFFLLHTPYVVNRIAGGFGRGFAFPLFALWLAGAITGDERPRWLAALGGALTQPNTVAIVLGAEGIFSVLDALGKSRGLLIARAKRYAALIFACSLLVVPYVLSQRSSGHVHTLAEAEKNPGFFRSGRQGELPFPDPVPQFASHFASPFAKAGAAVSERAAAAYARLDSTGPLLFVTALLLLALARLSPPARPALALFAATAVMYLLARQLAFRLYSPERYYSFGCPMAAIALGVGGVGLVGPRLSTRIRPLVRNAAASALIVVLTLLAGDGNVPKNGLYIDRRPQAKLYDFVHGLPVTARIACHPMDGDDIPWWAARATTGGLETVQVWLVEAWQRSEARTQETFRALYATSPDVVIDFARRWQVTHLLLRHDRYGDDFKRHVAFFEPLTGFANKLVAPLRRDQLVLAHVPASAIVYRDGTFDLVDVERLEAAWREGSGPKRTP